MGALNIAKSTNYSNWKVFLAEQAAQLYIKAVYYELIEDKLKGHEIRDLVGQLALELEKNGFSEEAKKLRDFVARNRDVLFFLEESYINSRYGEDFEDRFVDDTIKVLI